MGAREEPEVGPGTEAARDRRRRPAPRGKEPEAAECEAVPDGGGDTRGRRRRWWCWARAASGQEERGQARRHRAGGGAREGECEGGGSGGK